MFLLLIVDQTTLYKLVNMAFIRYLFLSYYGVLSYAKKNNLKMSYLRSIKTTQ